MRAASFTAGRVAQRMGRDKHLAGAAERARIGPNPGERMNCSGLCSALAAVALLGACDAEVRPEEPDNPVANSHVSAEGKAEEGKISLKMPGVDMTLSLPKGVADEARAERDSKLLYPGAILRGMAIAAGPDSDKSGDSEVEFASQLRTRSTRSPPGIAIPPALTASSCEAPRRRATPGWSPASRSATSTVSSFA